ncbi:uracil-xanthine permease family protein [Salinimonas sediminis]|uniref:Xanthine permease XanP n=1 Tax=Salinimonas sediminis TaxID=2303538 RepID=A0A346NKY0_9ALTE|nr:solute carrier family 23 protein [Salinimonas sediminis]AXR06187.1 xanthine permease XanP [Salinimonas sediminis]
MSKPHELLYALHDSPPAVPATIAAFQHLLASFIAVVTPTLIIAGVLELGDYTPYLVSMALFTSGVGTYVQTKSIGPVGCGLVAIQGTSFAFISALLVAGLSVRKQGGSDEDVLAMLFGISLFGALVEVVLSQGLRFFKRILTPLTSGIVITAIGLSLIKVGMTDLAGGVNATNLGNSANISLGLTVLFIIIFLNACHSRWLRLSAIFIAMAIGTVIAYIADMIDSTTMVSAPLFTLPVPLMYGLDFDLALFIPVAFIYFFSAIETAGDLTANSLFCKQPITGPVYLKRLKGGILADGLNSMFAACFNSFPNTTFGQNNGVIQLTGIASRKVGYIVAGMFVVLGCFPFIGVMLQLIPKPVLGGATLTMFSMVAVGGIKILTSTTLDRRASLIVASSLGLGGGVLLQPAAIASLPGWLSTLASSPITVAGVCAVVLELVLPRPAEVEPESVTEAKDQPPLAH